MVLLYMAATRTQIYLTRRQREELDRLVEREGASLAELIRDAVDEYLGARPVGIDEALRDTFGAVPEAEIPDRAEWEPRSVG